MKKLSNISLLIPVTFSTFTVSEDNPISVVEEIEVLRGVCHTASNTKTLAERSSGDINEGKSRGRVTFKIGVELTKSHKLFLSVETS